MGDLCAAVWTGRDSVVRWCVVSVWEELAVSCDARFLWRRVEAAALARDFSYAHFFNSQ